jgi:NAD(P)-dependent dehydrogenase (short-subunit alcohol dehydrogenase family)
VARVEVPVLRCDQGCGGSCRTAAERAGRLRLKLAGEGLEGGRATNVSKAATTGLCRGVACRLASRSRLMVHGGQNRTPSAPAECGLQALAAARTSHSKTTLAKPRRNRLLPRERLGSSDIAANAKPFEQCAPAEISISVSRNRAQSKRAPALRASVVITVPDRNADGRFWKRDTDSGPRKRK